MADVVGRTLGDDESEDGGPPKTFNDTRKTAQSYAWEYFKLHAQQRQASFRFYVIIVAALGAALISGEDTVPRSAVGASLSIVSFVFWRLDRRNAKLVRIAETYLREEEDRLSLEMKSENIRLLFHASYLRYVPIPLRYFTTYSQMNRLIFIAIGIVGLSVAWPDLKPFASPYLLKMSEWLRAVAS